VSSTLVVGDAMVSLGDVLRRIRNKRAHGFKCRGVERDGVILGAARGLLVALCEETLALSEVPWGIKRQRDEKA
jgi:hypothetical protein